LCGHAATVICCAHALNGCGSFSELLNIGDKTVIQSGKTDNATLNGQAEPSSDYTHRQVYFIAHSTSYANCHKNEDGQACGGHLLHHYNTKETVI
jgi:hypothetical protein